MKINIKDLQVNYIQYGKGKDILLLHGWGQNIEMMKPVGDNFANNYRITIIDFPGFGQSEEPKSPWTIEKYSHMLEVFVEKTNIKKPIVIGHSFGGRVAIRYSARNPIEKLILFGSPCIRIEEPTLLIWGENDTEAPLNEAKELEKIMNDAALIVLPGTHYAYLENLSRVISILESFI